jgi:hypothetical protein
VARAKAKIEATVNLPRYPTFIDDILQVWFFKQLAAKAAWANWGMNQPLGAYLNTSKPI